MTSSQKLLTGLTVTLALVAAWSWILTAPNLVLSTNAAYWQVQTWLWDNLYPNRLLIVSSYLGLVLILGLIFCQLLKKWEFPSVKYTLHWCLLVICPLLFSYNALSYDVFNYLFNAKMVVEYHANPHVQVALDFADDEWTRFMHNTHTPAPYGYGWTAVSVGPYLLGQGKFTLTWLLFRLTNVGLYLATVATLIYQLQHLTGQWRRRELVLFAFNPLVLIEVVMNMHNDLWMMLPAVWSLYLVYPHATSWSKTRRTFVSLGLLLFSLSIKYATVVLLPLWLYLVATAWLPVAQWPAPLKKQIKLSQWTSWLRRNFFDVAVWLLFVPLLTTRSQLFHPWYLVWCLTLAPLTKSRLTHTSLVILSLSSLARYWPYLWENGYADTTLLAQQLTTFLPWIVYLIWEAGGYYNRWRHAHAHHSI